MPRQQSFDSLGGGGDVPSAQPDPADEDAPELGAPPDPVDEAAPELGTSPETVDTCECSICKDAIDPDTEDPGGKVQRLCCGHGFHSSCINEWCRSKSSTLEKGGLPKLQSVY